MDIMKKIQADKNGCKYILFRIDILVSVFQQQKLMKKDILTETLFLRKKDKKHQKKNFVIHLLELIQVMQKRVMIQIMRLVMYKYLLMSSKIKKIKKIEKKLIKEKEMREKLEKELREKVEKGMRQKLEKELKDKNEKLKNLTNNQVTNNFEKIIIKN